MRRALKYAAIWCGATVVAVSVSWFGVRDVLRDEFVDDVDVEPFLAQTIAADERAVTRRPATPAPVTSAPVTSAPVTSAPVTPAPVTPAPRRTPEEQRRTPVPATKKPSNPSLKVVKVKGGEVAFTLGADGCRLVSATPVSGYTAKVARADGWIRVDLVRGEHGTGVFCIGHEQRTDTWEY
ncbi:hypothetical protein [Nonomuraea rubra]|uniref:hypothetical protein n=1 Tax=Nonomuraea rubra TaxID=46180 RepID=UPI0033C49886